MVYFISGLGADERVFRFLNLSGIEHRFINWCNPKKGERLADYCQRLCEQITDRENVFLIGLSFGGIVAQELAKLIEVKKVIIISSVKSPQEFSWPLKFVRKTQIHRLVPISLMQMSNRFTANYYFGFEPAMNRSYCIRSLLIQIRRFCRGRSMN